MMMIMVVMMTMMMMMAMMMVKSSCAKWLQLMKGLHCKSQPWKVRWDKIENQMETKNAKFVCKHPFSNHAFGPLKYAYGNDHFRLNNFCILVINFYLSLYFRPPWKFKILELALTWSQIQELFLNSASSNTSKHSPKLVMYRIYKMHPLFQSLASGFKESFEICSKSALNWKASLLLVLLTLKLSAPWLHSCMT